MISDAAVDRLRQAVSWPDLGGTRYRLMERIGEGGMGAVFLTEDTVLQRPVALKVLRDPAFDADAVERMLREARVIARLEHPGIVPVHDLGRLPDGRTYYVMKLVRGRRLDECVADDMPRAERLRIFGRICETAAFAHAHGVVHRDLKPQNIMVGPFGEVLVLDWGVAKLLRPSKGARDAEQGDSAAEADNVRIVGTEDREDAQPPYSGDEEATATRHTASGAVIGTPLYMSPEQARGEVDAVGPASDVYALGAILHFLLSGRPPNAKPSARAWSLPRRGGLRVPRPLEAICRKALAEQPQDRYQTATALARDVDCFLGGQPVVAYREGPLERGVRVARRHRALILLILAYCLMRTAFLLWGNV
ncbi:Serine/threonine-protein kinase PrkC [Phycisphaerae bacterium RAS1]|nr:Serine/threonine-protein kinase PrkC [Phycisphaerae bacterium RAS1]